MKTKRGLFLILLIIKTITGFAQDQQKIESPNLVNNGDFENGNTGFKSDFKFTDPLHCWGCYVITENIDQNIHPAMARFFVNPVPSTGKYYFIDMNQSGNQRLWYDSITVKPNTTYSFSCIVANVYANFENPGVMCLKVNSKKIFRSKTLSNASSEWFPLSGIYKSGHNETRIEISIVDEDLTLMGNDVGLDNIVFKEITGDTPTQRK